MNEHLRDRILRKLESLSDDRGYQILDYAEFLESRYAERPAQSTTPFTRFAEAVEDRLRAGKVSATTIAEAMNLMNRAANVLNGALAAGRSLTSDIVSASRASGAPQGSASHASAPPAMPDTAPTASNPAPSNPAPTNAGPPPEASSPAHDTKMPGGGGEIL